MVHISSESVALSATHKARRTKPRCALFRMVPRKNQEHSDRGDITKISSVGVYCRSTLETTSSSRHGPGAHSSLTPPRPLVGDSPNVHDSRALLQQISAYYISRGHAQFFGGWISNAHADYRRALELDPGSAEARRLCRQFDAKGEKRDKAIVLFCCMLVFPGR